MRRFATACFLAVTISVAAQEPPKLAVAGTEAAVVPDKSGKIAVDLTLRNESTETVPLRLWLASFASEIGTDVHAQWAITAQTLNADGTKGTATNPTVIQRGSAIALHVTAEGAWPAGTTTIQVRNGDVIIGKITVDQKLPLGVTPAGWSDGTPLAIRIEDGKPTYLHLNNADGVPWKVRWSLFAENRKMTDIVSIGAAQQAAMVALIDANDGKSPSRGWFDLLSAVDTLFHDDEVTGTLRLSALRGDGRADPLWPEREFSVKLQRSFWSTAGRMWLGSIVLALVLLAGGVCSLVANNFIPNWRRKARLIERIATASSRLRALADEVRSLTRVRARVDAQQLLERVKRRWTTSSDFAAVVEAAEAEATRLEKRADILERIGTAMNDVLDDADRFAPRWLTVAFDRLGDAQSLLSNGTSTDAMLADAEAALTAARKILSDIENPTDAMRTKAAADVKTALDRIGDKGVGDVLDAIADVKNWIKSSYTDVANITADKFCRIDAALAKFDLVVEFAAAIDAAGLPPDDRVTKVAQLASLLNSDEYPAFRSARTLVLQCKQRVGPDHVKQAIEAGKYLIDIDPDEVDVVQTSVFRVVFEDARLNTHAAREGIACEWSFGDRFRESGWEVAHYYRRAGSYPVTVTFKSAETRIGISKPVSIEVAERDKEQFLGNQTYLDMVRLSILLGAAVIGLLAGAKDQIVKLDLVPGLIAVFLIGFSADQIKNILAPKS